MKYTHAFFIFFLASCSVGFSPCLGMDVMREDETSGVSDSEEGMTRIKVSPSMVEDVKDQDKNETVPMGQDIEEEILSCGKLLKRLLTCRCGEVERRSILSKFDALWLKFLEAEVLSVAMFCFFCMMTTAILYLGVENSKLKEQNELFLETGSQRTWFQNNARHHKDSLVQILESLGDMSKDLAMNMKDKIYDLIKSIYGPLCQAAERVYKDFEWTRELELFRQYGEICEAVGSLSAKLKSE